MLNPQNTEFEDLIVHLGIDLKVLVLQDSYQCLVLADDLLIRVDRLLCVLLNFLRRLSQALETGPCPERRVQTHANHCVFRTLPDFLQIVSKLLYQRKQDCICVSLQVALLALVCSNRRKTVARVD